MIVPRLPHQSTLLDVQAAHKQQCCQLQEVDEVRLDCRGQLWSRPPTPPPHHPALPLRGTVRLVTEIECWRAGMGEIQQPGILSSKNVCRHDAWRRRATEDKYIRLSSRSTTTTSKRPRLHLHPTRSLGPRWKPVNLPTWAAPCQSISHLARRTKMTFWFIETRPYQAGDPWVYWYTWQQRPPWRSASQETLCRVLGPLLSGLQHFSRRDLATALDLEEVEEA